MKPPLVTVAMPVRNGGRFLREALDAVRGQTYRDLEIVISDNASTDSTPEICAAAVREDSRVRYVRHEIPLPVGANFDYGRSAKLGAYFMWAADDDLRDVDQVRRFVEALESRPEAVLVYSWTQTVDAERRPLEVIGGYGAGIEATEIAERVRAFASNSYRFPMYGLMRSAAIDGLAPLSSRADTDGEFLFRLVLRGPFITIPEALFVYRLHRPLGYHDTIMEPRPGDPVLGRLAMYRGLVKEANLDVETRRRLLNVLAETMRAGNERRFHWLVQQVLEKRGSARLLLGWARQYPEVLRTRFFWGALRLLLMRGRESGARSPE